jgi:hypothetical protein
MRQFTEDTLTDAVVARLKNAEDPRFRQIMTSAVKHLHAFAREVQLSEEEWFEGIKFLTSVGQKCDDKRQEFILLSDILGLSMMIVALNHKTVPGATEATVLGPFFAHGAKEYEYGADLREGASLKGEDVYVSGRVLPAPSSTSGRRRPTAFTTCRPTADSSCADASRRTPRASTRSRATSRSSTACRSTVPWASSSARRATTTCARRTCTPSSPRRATSR